MTNIWLYTAYEQYVLVYSSVAASATSEGRRGVETSNSTALSHSKAQRQNKLKDIHLRRPSQDIAKESAVLAGELTLTHYLTVTDC